MKNKENATQVERVEPNIKAGLSSLQVQQRFLAGLNNNVKSKTSKSYWKIIVSNTFTFFNILCFAICAVLIAIGSFTNILFIFIFLANLLIGVFQECKSKHTVDKISLLTIPKSVVVRDGKLCEIDIANIVVDDIVKFELGNQISADCIVVDGTVEVNENLLTGESNPVKKDKGDTLFSGSFVVSGACYARADKVGENSYISTLIKKAKQVQKPQSDILKTLNIIIKSIGVIIIPLAVLTFIDVYLKNGNNIITAIENTSGSMLGMIPAGMFLLTSVALAVGVIKLASKRTLVQDLYSIEMLARADILCLDKTGTLTDGTMKVNKLISLNKIKEEQAEELLRQYMGAFDTANSTSLAIIERYGKEEVKPYKVLQFSSERKYSAVEFKKGESYALGAAEFIGAKLSEDEKALIENHINMGMRVLILAKSNIGLKDNKFAPKGTAIAILVVEDTIRADAVDVIKWFEKNEVDVKIISGDNATAVSKISKLVGLKDAEKFISLEGLSDQQVIDSANKYVVFGRVTPEQKCLLIKALKQDGKKKVAMTGDGVNDILALKEADCSIAMASGSEATRSASNLVMLDSNFSSMPTIVAEGRRVINNISKSSSLFLMKTFFTIFLTIFCLITSYEYPFQPKHLLLLETLFVGIPSFFLALQANNEKVKGTFLSSLISKAIPAGLVLTFNVMLSYIFLAIIGNADSALLVTTTSLTLTFSGAIILLKICMPLDWYRCVMWVGATGLCALALWIVGNSFFDYCAIPISCVIFITIAVASSYFTYWGLNVLCDKYLRLDKIKFGKKKVNKKQ